MADAQIWYDLIQDRRLRVAKRLNIETFDLADTMGPLVNGPQRGLYMYDAIHYTPIGAVEVANQLKPVLDTLLRELDN